MGQAYKVGIVGLGAIGHRVAKDFLAHPQTMIAAVCDVNESLVREAASTMQATGYTNHKDMLKNETLDVVYVAVPPKFHHQVVMDVVAAGIHVLCEKPLALTLPEAEEMASSAAGQGIVTALNLPLHYEPSLNKFSSLLHRKAIGTIRRIDLDLIYPEWPRKWQQSAWVGGREQGGPVRETTPHWFHILLREFGKVQRVLARVNFPTDPQKSESDALGIIELASGIQVSVNVLANLPHPETVSMTVFGSTGSLALRNWVNLYETDDDGVFHPVPEIEDEFVTPGLVSSFVAALSGQEARLCGFEVGLEIQKVLDAWERSSQSGDWVSIE